VKKVAYPIGDGDTVKGVVFPIVNKTEVLSSSSAAGKFITAFSNTLYLTYGRGSPD